MSDAQANCPACGHKMAFWTPPKIVDPELAYLRTRLRKLAKEIDRAGYYWAAGKITKLLATSERAEPVASLEEKIPIQLHPVDNGSRRSRNE